MQTLVRSYLARVLITLVAVTTLSSVTAVVPAQAAVYSSCTMTRCAAARSANTIWKSKNYPTTRTWYTWPDGRWNFAGGTFYNREGQLPAGATYNEYDVYSRAKGAARDAYRIVVNRSTGTVWFSPDHYGNFYRL